MVNVDGVSLFEAQETAVFTMVVSDGLDSAHRACTHTQVMAKSDSKKDTELKKKKKKDN